MRKKPPGVLLKSAHQVDREYRVMTALHGTDVPVPKTYVLCEDDAIIGQAFYVMDFVEGRVIADPFLPSFTPEERTALYDDFARVLACLHRVDRQAVGLGDFGREGNYYERQISRWSKQYIASETEKVPAMDKLMEWVTSNIPDVTETTLVHGDYRIGNCIIHPTEPKIAAVLDWELATTGHPLADVGYCCMTYHGVTYQEGKQVDLKALGIPDEKEFVATYCRYAGRDTIENWDFYILYNLFRSAAIVQGVYKRGVDGNASSDRWKEMHDRCVETASIAWNLVEQGKM
jgi:aminoglycoside phosphotransferase (APT) family kinase protein